MARSEAVPCRPQRQSDNFFLHEKSAGLTKNLLITKDSDEIRGHLRTFQSQQRGETTLVDYSCRKQKLL